MWTLRFPSKALRAEVIARHVREARCYQGVVCFSCGNASRALREALMAPGDPPVLDISPSGALEARVWWSPERIRSTWPTYFDATSGHLPAYLMVRVARHFRAYLGPRERLIERFAPYPTERRPDETVGVPTGSGETIVCLRWAYPHVQFVPVQDGTPATERHSAAPLLGLALEGV